MQTSRWEIFKGQIRRSVIQKSTTEWSVVGVCLLLAASVWLIAALSKTYSYNISLPVQFDVDKEAFVSSGPIPKRVKLKVTGIGWSLVKHQLGVSKSQLVIKPEFVYRDGTAIVTSKHIYQSASQQLPDLLVAYALADSVSVQFYPILKINLPLAVSTNSIQVAEDKAVTSPVLVHPTKIEVRGLAEDLKALPAVYSLELSGKNYDTDVEEVVALDIKPYPKLRFAQAEALVSFKVGKLVGWQHSIKVENQTGSALTRDSVMVFCQMDERLISVIRSDSFRVVASGVKGQPWATIRLKHHPSNVINPIIINPSIALMP